MYELNARAMVTAPFSSATDSATSTTSRNAPDFPKPPNANPRPEWSALRRLCRVTLNAGNRPLTMLTSNVSTTTNSDDPRIRLERDPERPAFERSLDVAQRGVRASQSGGGGDRSEQQRFKEQLADDAGASRAERGANRQLRRSRPGSREHQRRDVAGHDQQHHHQHEHQRRHHGFGLAQLRREWQHMQPRNVVRRRRRRE